MTPEESKRLERCERMLRRIGLRLKQLDDALRSGKLTLPAPTGAVASDAELDGQYGDEEIKKDPKRWKGRSFVGKKMSQCPPEFLDELAGFADWSAERDEEKGAELPPGEEQSKKRKGARYGRKRAALARGWAARNRAVLAAAVEAAKKATEKVVTTPEVDCSDSDFPAPDDPLGDELDDRALDNDDDFLTGDDDL